VLDSAGKAGALSPPHLQLPTHPNTTHHPNLPPPRTHSYICLTLGMIADEYLREYAGVSSCPQMLAYLWAGPERCRTKTTEVRWKGKRRAGRWGEKGRG
jgi:hypothetical protein